MGGWNPFDAVSDIVSGVIDIIMDVVDIIAVRETELMTAAIAKGCNVIGGVPMAVGQLSAFVKFFDPAQKVDVS